MPNGLKKFMDDTFGPPGEALKTLKGVSEALTSVDQAKLRQVKSVLDTAAKVKGSPEELSMVLDLIRLIAGINMEQLTAIRDIMVNLTKLVRLLPSGGLKTLPIQEILEEMKKGS